MLKEQLTYNTTLQFRVGKKTDIYAAFDQHRIEFSCPANWFNYAQFHNNRSTGDLLECTFAHIKASSFDEKSILDSHGVQMGDHLIKLERGDSYYLQLLPVLLIPTFCMFSFDLDEWLSFFRQENKDYNGFEYDLDRYCESMGYSIDDAAYFVVLKPEVFREELKHQIPLAVKTAIGQLQSEMYYSTFDPLNPLQDRLVDYSRYDENNFFNLESLKNDSIFYKKNELSWQSEVRYTIPSVGFINRNYYESSYDWKKNTLAIDLPQLGDYAQVFDAKDIKAFSFIEEQKGSFQFRVIGRDS